jgi:large subunit ribosomal protein L21
MILRGDGDDTQVGTPFLAGAKVTAEVIDQFRDKKVVVYKYKRRKGYHKKQGHRQYYSVIKVDEIVGS